MQATLSGTISMFRQGVSITQVKHTFYSANVPQIWSEDSIVLRQSGSYGDPNKFFDDALPDTALGIPSSLGSPSALESRVSHGLLQTIHGQSYEFNEETPFVDQVGYSSGSTLRDMTAGSIPSYPNPVFYTSLVQDGQMDGVIEPLTIRRFIDRRGDLQGQLSGSKFYPHTIKASISSMYTLTLRNNTKISQFIYNGKNEAPVTVPFFDSQNVFLTSSLPLPGNIDFRLGKFTPFVDISKKEYKWADYGDHDFEMKEVLYQLTGSSENSLLPFDHKSSTAGFTYGHNPEGTDSLAFGGWLK